MNNTIDRKALIEKLEHESDLAGFLPYPRDEGALFMADTIRIWAESIPSTESEGEAERLRSLLETAKEALTAVVVENQAERIKAKEWCDSVEKEARQYLRERDEARTENERLRTALQIFADCKNWTKKYEMFKEYYAWFPYPMEETPYLFAEKTLSPTSETAPDSIDHFVGAMEKRNWQTSETAVQLEVERLRTENEKLNKSNERLRFIARQHNPHLQEDNL